MLPRSSYVLCWVLIPSRGFWCFEDTEINFLALLILFVLIPSRGFWCFEENLYALLVYERMLPVLIPSRGFWCFEATTTMWMCVSPSEGFNPLTGILVF